MWARNQSREYARQPCGKNDSAANTRWPVREPLHRPIADRPLSIAPSGRLGEFALKQSDADEDRAADQRVRVGDEWIAITVISFYLAGALDLESQNQRTWIEVRLSEGAKTCPSPPRCKDYGPQSAESSCLRALLSIEQVASEESEQNSSLSLKCGADACGCADSDGSTCPGFD
jgi:hypothetical protein